MSDLSKIATAEPVYVTDGSSQAAALASSLPGSSSVGLVVRDAAQGQATMANSRPVAIASDQSALSTNLNSVQSSTVAHGQISVTTSAAAATTQALAKGVTLRALRANTDIVYVGITGVTSSTGFPLYPGDTANFTVDNLNRLFLISGSGTQTVCWIGQN